MIDFRTKDLKQHPLPLKIPGVLKYGDIRLKFMKWVEGDSQKGLVPYYHFKILNESQENVGHINFRVGDTRHIILCAGHVGYEILPEFRGRNFGYQACLALSPFIRSHYDTIILTTDPENTPSKRIIEKLGGTLMNEIEVPNDDPAYIGGARRKVRYKWSLPSLIQGDIKID